MASKNVQFSDPATCARSFAQLFKEQVALSTQWVAAHEQATSVARSLANLLPRLALVASLNNNTSSSSPQSSGGGGGVLGLFSNIENRLKEKHFSQLCVIVKSLDTVSTMMDNAVRSMRVKAEDAYAKYEMVLAQQPTWDADCFARSFIVPSGNPASQSRSNGASSSASGSGKSSKKLVRGGGDDGDGDDTNSNNNMLFVPAITDQLEWIETLASLYGAESARCCALIRACTTRFHRFVLRRAASSQMPSNKEGTSKDEQDLDDDDDDDDGESPARSSSSSSSHFASFSKSVKTTSTTTAATAQRERKVWAMLERFHGEFLAAASDKGSSSSSAAWSSSQQQREEIVRAILLRARGEGI